MGITRAELELRNPRRRDLPPVSVNALVDTGSTYLSIPSTVRDALQLDDAQDDRRLVLADGSPHVAPYVGPVEVGCLGRKAYVGAVVLDAEPLLGQVPMEDMDLAVVPKTGELIADNTLRMRQVIGR